MGILIQSSLRQWWCWLSLVLLAALIMNASVADAHMLQREAEAKLEIIKILVPNNDPGKFNLQIDGVIHAADVGNGGGTGERQVSSGIHTVAETAGTGTDLANYTSQIECRTNNGEGIVIASSNNAGPLNVPVGEGDDIVCIITNTGQMAKLEVVKILSPDNDPGRFNLQIDGATYAINVGHGGSTGERIVAPGVRTVAETAAIGTDLANYASSIECRADNGAGDLIAGGSNAGPLDVPVSEGDDIVCTITNTRVLRGSITIVKEATPEGDQVFNFTSTIPGMSSFTLVDDSANPDQKTKTFSDLRAGSYTIREIVPQGWVLMSISCSNGHSDSLPQAAKITVNLQPGEALTCIFTNNKPAVEAGESYQLFLPLIVN